MFFWQTRGGINNADNAFPYARERSSANTLPPSVSRFSAFCRYAFVSRKTPSRAGLLTYRFDILKACRLPSRWRMAVRLTVAGAAADFHRLP